MALSLASKEGSCSEWPVDDLDSVSSDMVDWWTTDYYSMGHIITVSSSLQLATLQRSLHSKSCPYVLTVDDGGSDVRAAASRAVWVSAIAL